ncbi:hypothetical protein MTO96_046302 [Rhipicephalus appendiculatus]
MLTKALFSAIRHAANVKTALKTMRCPVSKGHTLKGHAMIIIIAVADLGPQRISQRKDSAGRRAFQLPENTRVMVRLHVSCVSSCLGTARRCSASSVMHATSTSPSTFYAVTTLKAFAAAIHGGSQDILHLYADPRPPYPGGKCNVLNTVEECSQSCRGGA